MISELDEGDKKTIMAYQRVLTTDDGKAVLLDILNDLGFFHESLETPQQLALHNAAVRILKKLGIWYPDLMFGITDKLTELSILNEE